MDIRKFKIPGFLKNKYAITIIFFLVWVLFIDQYNMIFQWQLSKELNTAKKMETYYTQKILEVNNEKEKLFTGSESIIRFAREQYLMKKDNEDLFIIVVEE